MVACVNATTLLQLLNHSLNPFFFFFFPESTINAPHFLSHSNSHQLPPLGKASHHLFITCYHSPIAHAKIKLFGDTPFPMFNTILLLIKNSSSPCHYQHELTIIHCLQRYKSFVSTSPNALNPFISFIFLYVFNIHFLYSCILRITPPSSFRITFIKYICLF